MKITLATDKPFAKEAVDKIKAIITDSGFEFGLLESYKTPQELIDEAKITDSLIIRSDLVTKDVINAGDRLKIVVRAGAGYDNVDLDAATQKGIVVMNTPGQNSNAVAELVFGTMVFMARTKFNGNSGTELKDKKIGIHAFGNVGRNVARIAKGFGMETYAFDAFVSPEDIQKDDVKALQSVQELYSECQYISLHIPANADTKKSIGFELLSKMPKNAVLVNTARKEVINEEDLLRIFESRKDFCYISDIAPDNASVLMEKYADRCFFTPKKIGAQTEEANVNAGIAAAVQIINFFENGDKKYQVNK
jgi:D-3-phosphoglycerate dehydrogenase